MRSGTTNLPGCWDAEGRRCFGAEALGAGGRGSSCVVLAIATTCAPNLAATGRANSMAGQSAEVDAVMAVPVVESWVGQWAFVDVAW